MLLKDGSLAAFLCGVVLIACPAVLTGQAKSGPWVIDGESSALQLAGVEEQPSFVELSLRNVSTKVITAFAYSIGPNWQNLEYFIDYFGATPDGLAPEGVRKVKLPVELVSSSAHRVLHLRASVFGDGSAEGSAPHIRCIEATRIGRMTEAERIYGQLRTIQTGRTDLSELARNIGKLPESAEEAVSSLKSIAVEGTTAKDVDFGDVRSAAGFLQGVRKEREDALRTIASVPASSPASGEALVARMVADYMRVSEHNRSQILRTKGGHNSVK